MNSAASLAAQLRRDVLLGTDQAGRQVYVPLEELKQTSTHIIGASGYGKSFWLKNIVHQFVRHRQPFSLIDPHRDLYDFAVSILRRSTAVRSKIILLDPSEASYSTAFNPLCCGITEPGDAASLVLEACLKAWGADTFDQTPRLEGVLRGTLRLLIEGQLTLLEAPEILNIDNSDLRLALRERVSDDLVRRDWIEFEKWPRQEKLAIVESTRNRLRRFLQSEPVQLMVAQRDNALNIRTAMDDGHYILANLGSFQAPETRRLVGALLVNAFFHASKQRHTKNRRDYFLIIDEAGQFATRDLANSLDELRKQGAYLICAHQRLHQLEREDPDLLSAFLTNAKARVVFGGLERPEAERLAKEFFTGQARGDRVKHRAIQTKFRPVLDTFEVETESWSDSDGVTESSAHTLTEANGWGRTIYGQRAEASAHSSQTSSGSKSSASGSSSSSSWSSSTGGSRSIVPITRHEEFREESSRQFWNLDEEWERLTARVHGLAKRQALVRIHNGPVIQIRTPDVSEEPSFGRVERFKRGVLKRSTYARPASAVVCEIEARREQLRLMGQRAAGRDLHADIRPGRRVQLKRRRP